MMKIATLASVAALAAASMSASAWWTAPYGPCGMTEDQQKAMQEQHQAMIEQQNKAMERMMTAQQAGMAKRMQERDVDRMTMGFPGGMDPWGEMSMPETPAFGQIPEIPGFGQMPEMPGFGQMPDMSTPYGMDMPMAYIPPHVQARHAAIQTQRAKAMEELKARRDRTMKEMAERRKDMEANRFARPSRYGHSFASPYTMTAKAPEMPAAAPQAAPAVEAPVVEAAPAPAAGAVPVAPAAPAPATEATPVTPTQATATPQS